MRTLQQKITVVHAVFLTAMLASESVHAGARSAQRGVPGHPIAVFHKPPTQPDAFMTHGRGYALWLVPEGMVLALRKPQGAPSALHIDPERPCLAGDVEEQAETSIIQIRFPGAASRPRLRAEDPRTTKVNYLRGDDSTRWIRGLTTHGRVRHEGLYRGVDLVSYGSAGELEFDFEVKPGASPRAIAMEFRGADRLELDPMGSLLIHTPAGAVTLLPPQAYQKGPSGNEEVKASFEVISRTQARFVLGKYDRARTLIIDPVLLYSTWLGGDGDERGLGVAVGSDGSAYVVGDTWSWNFPVRNPLQAQIRGDLDGFVTKLSPTGDSIEYSTFLGGGGYDAFERALVTSSGQLYTIGSTRSHDFPVVNAFQSSYGGGPYDGMIVRLDSTGTNLEMSTYFGGDGDDAVHAIALGPAGEIHLVGHVTSGNFPLKRPMFGYTGGFDGWVARMTADGRSLDFSTYYARGADIYGLALDVFGNIWVAGHVASNLPPVNALDGQLGGSADAFVAKINAAGDAVHFATYLGGSGLDGARAVELDAQGNAYVAGWTTSADFPLVSPVQDHLGGTTTHDYYRGDAFLTKVDANGTALMFSTYLGSEKDDSAWDLAVTGDGVAYAIGSVGGPSFPIVDGYQPVFGGPVDDRLFWGDGFLAVVDTTSASLIYSTFLGGSSADYAYGVALGPFGDVYVSGITTSSDFPVTQPVVPRRGGRDAFLIRVLVEGAQVQDLHVEPRLAGRIVGAEHCVVATVTDNNGDPVGGVAVAFNVSPTHAAQEMITTDETGVATFCYAGEREGTDDVTVVADTLQDVVTVVWTAPQACPANTQPGHGSAIRYVGSTTAACDEVAELTAQLVGQQGEPLAGRTLVFTAEEQELQAVTDDAGVARVRAILPNPGALTVTFAGDAAYDPSSLLQVLQPDALPTTLLVTGPRHLTAGAAGVVSAVLQDGVTGAPLAGETVTFAAGADVVEAVTDATGLATATVTAGADATSINAYFAGSPCHATSSASMAVRVLTGDTFVIWGGNSTGLHLGDRVNFWGAQWAKQVQEGDYDAHAEFKGYAEVNGDVRLCQVQSNRHSTPPLNPGCWTSKPGNSHPPVMTAPARVQALVATSIDKQSGVVFGNIAGVVVLELDAAPAYGPDPGHPGYGTIVEVVMAGEGVGLPLPSELTPRLSVTQLQDVTTNAGTPLTVTLHVVNTGNVAVVDGTATLAAPWGEPALQTAALGALPVGAATDVTFVVTSPSLRRRPDESAAAYEARLAAEDGRRLATVSSIAARTADGRSHEILGAGSSTTLRVPRLSLALHAPACAGAGAAVFYDVTVANVGSAGASQPRVLVRFADGSEELLILPDLPQGAAVTRTVSWRPPSPPARALNESEEDYLARLSSLNEAPLVTTASAVWTGEANGQYGAVEGAATSLNGIPVLELLAAVTPGGHPGEDVNLDVLLLNRGHGNAFLVGVQVTMHDGTIEHASVDSIGAGESEHVVFSWPLPPVAVRGSSESDAAYRQRLLDAAGRVVMNAVVQWHDAAGGALGPLQREASTVPRVPIVDVQIQGPPEVTASQSIRYQVTIANVGTGAASDVRLTVSLPDGSVRSLPPMVLGVGGERDLEVPGIVPASGLGPTLTARGEARWSDVAQAYGPLGNNAVATALNSAPRVEAGANVSLVLPQRTVALQGIAVDDGLPGGAVSATWSLVDGPGAVSFSNVNALQTSVTLTATGLYTLRLTATDTVLSARDDVVIELGEAQNQAPVVNAGPDLAMVWPADSVELLGAVTDDELPPTGALQTIWTVVSAPGDVTFGDSRSSTTTATLTARGTYELELVATDGVLFATDRVVVTYTLPANDPPVVSAGNDVTLTWPDNVVALDGYVADDGRPVGGALVAQWSQVSGPRSVVFADTGAVDTTVEFRAAGTYVLRLAAYDGQDAASDSVQVNIMGTGGGGPAPVVGALSLQDGTIITQPTTVAASIQSDALERWDLEYRELGAETWNLFGSGTTQSVGGTLDPTLLLNGLIQVRLVATDTAGQVTEGEAIFVEVDGNMKVGNFTLAFTDLSVPVMGIPIEVTRTYDSRDKRQGDFGVGWQLGIKNVRLQESGIVGSRWRMDVINGFFDTYCVRPVRQKRVTVTLPDGDVHEFVPRLEPQCQSIIPQQEATVVFVPQPGTTSTLTPLNDYVLVAGNTSGDFPLIDADTLDVMDPELYILKLRDGRRLMVNDDGKLLSIRDLNGNTLDINDDGMVHSSGQSISFERDALGRITSINDPLGKSLTYRYDARGDLASVTDREGQETTFAYNATHGLLDIFDPRGVRAVRNEYDADGRLLSHTDASGNVIAYVHDLAAQVETVTDRLGNVTTHEYDSRGNVLRTVDAEGGVTTRSYDGFDNKLSETDPLGNTTFYTYNDERDVTSVTDALGHVTQSTYNTFGSVLTHTDARGKVSRNFYDVKGNLETARDPTGAATDYQYTPYGQPWWMRDALGRITLYAYDPNGNLSSETDPLGHVTSYTYDANGNRASQTTTRTTPDGVEKLITGYVYDSENRLVETVHPDGTTTSTRYNAIGKQASTTDGLGRETRYVYDDHGRLTETQFPDGTTEGVTYDAEGRRLTSTDRGGRVTRYEYDRVGRLTKMIHPDRMFRMTTYDLAGRVVAETDENGNTVTFVYDDAGRRTVVRNALGHSTRSDYDENGNLTSVTDANEHTTTFAYDDVGRRVKTTAPNGTYRTTGYDALGRRISETDELGRTTQYGYDELGRLTSVTDALVQVTSYGYDELGNMVSQTDANGHTTRFEHDKLGRRVKRTLPMGQSETMSYDAVGNMTSRTDFSGHTTTYAYDELNRLLSKTPDPALNEPTVSFTYFSTGQRQSMTDAWGATTYSYDDRDRLLTKATPAGTLTYTYDDVGNVRSIRSSNAGGTDVQYEWDAANQLAAVVDSNTGTTTYAYDPVGNVAGMTLANGVVSQSVYDEQNRLTDLSYMRGTMEIARYTHTIAPTGHRTGVAETSGRQVAYTFDELYRLTSEMVTNDPNGLNGTVTYAYDAVGNRLTRTSTLPGVTAQTFFYNENDQLSDHVYNTNGATVDDGSQTYAYNFEGHLVDVDGGRVTFQYDGDGNRVAQTIHGTAATTTLFLVDTLNPTRYSQVVEEVESGLIARRYTFGVGVLAQQVAGATHLMGVDGRTSVRLLMDAVGTITDEWTYDAFGATTFREGTTPTPYQYLGERHYSESGLVHLRARDVALGVGRFQSMDPHPGLLDRPSSLHRYVYGANDPVNLVDRSGLLTTPEVQTTTVVQTSLQAMPKVIISPTILPFAGAILVAGAAAVGGAIAYQVAVAFKYKNNDAACGRLGAKKLYRAMTEAPDGYPETSPPSSSTLAARINVDVHPFPGRFGPDTVAPADEGMSVAPDYIGNLLGRLPRSLGGPNNKPAFCINVDQLPEDLRYVPDPTKPGVHGFVGPSREMSFDDYQGHLASTRLSWLKVADK
ncbi:MAG: RHS repeat-associated core domain-containing protein [Myxococcota bacterium]